MGACFSKVFNECPLIVYSSTSWVHPETRGKISVYSVLCISGNIVSSDLLKWILLYYMLIAVGRKLLLSCDLPTDQYIIFACEEGIYTFNLTQIHEGVMDQVSVYYF